MHRQVWTLHPPAPGLLGKLHQDPVCGQLHYLGSATGQSLSRGNPDHQHQISGYINAHLLNSCILQIFFIPQLTLLVPRTILCTFLPNKTHPCSAQDTEAFYCYSCTQFSLTRRLQWLMLGNVNFIYILQYIELSYWVNIWLNECSFPLTFSIYLCL